MIKTFRAIKNRKLANQLVASFIGMFILVFVISVIFAYSGIANLLRSNWENNNIVQLAQYDYNLTAFRNEIDYVSRQIVMQGQTGGVADLQTLMNYGRLSDLERSLVLYNLFRGLSDKLASYPAIESVAFFLEEGLVIKISQLENQVEFDKNSKLYRQYIAAVYPAAMMEPQKLIWLGGIKKDDVWQSGATARELGKQAGQSGYYISAARSVTYGKRVGTVMINIDMRTFTKIYNNASKVPENELYMTDASGVIVSHYDESQIGQIRAEPKQPPRQIVIRNVDSLNWKLVSEIPLGVFGKDVLTLREIGLTMFALGVLLATLLSFYWIRRVTRPLIRLTAAMKKVEQGNFGMTVEAGTYSNELEVLIRQFNRMSMRLSEVIGQKEAIEEEKREIEIKALQSQINPHFLYNTLNTVKWMAVMVKADNIAESVTTLGDLLRPLFQKHDVWCTIEEEVAYTKHYIRIMNYRYAESIRTEILVPEQLKNEKILRFMLQPLVENAIYHGLNNRNGGHITITFARQGDDIVVRVADNGRGITHERLKEVAMTLDAEADRSGQEEDSGQGIGLGNVQRRVRLHFGEKYGLSLHSEPDNGTVVELKIPVVRKS
ncbi:histidine kinase [Paenibacillus sp. GCM10027626]|uniref:sensor histidine kinase n=1 Tax=Paenibacillus sp. GCM10027626 TaxID=3273411 RepID=UPI0036380513